MKHKIDIRSIKFKTWLYFVLFTGLLMVVLWGLQVIFLNNFYEGMKTQQTKATIEDINEAYNSYSADRFIQKVGSIATANDLYVYLSDEDGMITSFQPSEEVSGAGFYFQQIGVIENYRERSKSGSVLFRINGVDNTKEVLVYSDRLAAKNKEAFNIYLFSPLWPVKSTINILRNQLIYITLIALILACLVSFYLSTRITRPIRQIVSSAERLAKGEYGIVFKGGHYTEINNLADTLTRTSIELEKTDVMQKDLVANVSHDLRTPLTMIKSYAEMIRDLSGDDPVKRGKHLQVIIDEADRLNYLVDDLLTVSKMQSGKMTLNIKEFNLSEAARSIVGTYQIRLEDGYSINLDCPSEFFVTGDEERIKQVMSNLITNAIKFCGEDKVVNVTLAKQGRSGVRFSVEDHGVGIAKDELEHVWERYYKASSNMVRTTEGSGLGLSIVKEILVLHKAEYGVDSTLGEGTTFWFELNLTKVDETAVNPVFTLSDGNLDEEVLIEEN
ncbi:MAG: sensor histidine kinase [Firmicutes bacterium]|nr:sensor histidine kinase [Bacillota bacterium]